jgi:hypothetical protein
MSTQKEKYFPGRKKIFYFSFYFLCTMLFFTDKCFSEDKNTYFELLFGGGNDLKSQKSTHILVAPALNWTAKDYLKVRLEADFEIIENNNDLFFISGIAPFLKFISQGTALKPFIELGAGVNYLSKTTIANQALGGHFTFSLMSGVGIEFPVKKVPINLSYRFRHLSNGGIYDLNFGLDSHYIIIGIRLKDL